MSEANRFDDLPPKTKKFLSNLRDDEIDTLDYGIRLMSSAVTLGKFMKWVLAGLLGLFVGVIMLGESFSKIAGWFKG